MSALHPFSMFIVIVVSVALVTSCVCSHARAARTSDVDLMLDRALEDQTAWQRALTRENVISRLALIFTSETITTAVIRTSFRDVSRHSKRDIALIKKTLGTRSGIGL